jgi:hypothetical protein
MNKLYVPTSSGGTSYGVGSNGKVLKSNGSTVYWGSDNNTTYSNATTSTAGLMSATDKAKLDALVGDPDSVVKTPLGWEIIGNDGQLRFFALMYKDAGSGQVSYPDNETYEIPDELFGFGYYHSATPTFY